MLNQDIWTAFPSKVIVFSQLMLVLPRPIQTLQVLMLTTIPFGQYSSPALFLVARTAARVLPTCPFSTCDTPGISRHPHPDGEPCIGTKCAPPPTFGCLAPPAAGRFSRFRLRSRQGGHVYTTAQVWVPPDSMVRALGVHSRVIWRVITGSPCAEPSLAGHWKPHNVRFLLWFCC